MAKTKMLCPFTDELCQECPMYRGRHYYLCFHAKYRGYLEKSGKMPKPRTWQTEPQPKFDIPLLLPHSPKWIAFNDYIQRKKK
jgi:hypothetical protein